MQSMYLTESHDWQANLTSLDTTPIELSSQLSDLYANAKIALQNADRKKGISVAKQVLKEMQQRIINRKHKKESHVDYFTSITSQGLILAQIMVLELQGQIQQLEGNLANAISLFKKATHLESNTSFGYGPPIPVEPSYELLATAYMLAGQYTAAYKEWIIDLKRMPNRVIAVEGLANVKEKLKIANLPIPEGITPYYNKLFSPNFYH